MGESFIDFIPVIGTIWAAIQKPKGSESSDYHYAMDPRNCTTPMEADVAIAACEVALSRQAWNYTIVENSSDAVGLGVDAVVAALGLLRPPVGWVFAAIGGIEGYIRVGIIAENNRAITAGCDAAKKSLCKCPCETK